MVKFSKNRVIAQLSVLMAAGLFIAQSCSAAPAPNQKKTVEALKLTMRTDFYGETQALISGIGLKFNSPRMGVNLIALPPDGRMYAFNSEERKIYKVDINKYNIPGISQAQYKINSTKGQFFLTGKTAKICGMNAIEFANYKTKELPAIRKQRIHALRSGHPELALLPSEIWVSTEMSLPRSFLSIVSKMSQINEKQLMQLCGPSKSKLIKAPIPLRILRVADDGKKFVAVDTLTATKTKATEDEFQLPTGYKSVNSELELFIGEGETLDFGLSNRGATPLPKGTTTPDSKKSIDDFAKELGIDSKKAK